MPRYLLKASYIGEGVKGLLRDGGSKRRAAVEEAVKSIGAKIEAFYFVLGDPDVIVILDAPDLVSAAALSLVVNASGAVRLNTDVLLTPEELDLAAKKAPPYRAPGH